MRLMKIISKPVSIGAGLALGVVLSACSGTKLIEQDDTITYQPPEQKSSRAKVYSSDAVGSVEDLYGEASIEEQSLAYRDAVAQVPELRYNVVYFAYDSAEISEEGQEVLRHHADYLLEEADVFITLEGHADKRGSEGYNLALGERRARAVKNFLVAFGVAQSQLATVSFGEEKPVAYGDSEEAYRKNRRVEIIYQ